MNIVTENKVSFKALEEYFFTCGCKLAAKALGNHLQEIDRELMKSRDKELLRHKGHRKTCIKTIMGEVEYSRAVYQVMDGSAEKKFVYLLDEYLGLDNIGFVSSTLACRIADNVCETSYAQTAKNISTLTGQSISRQGVWNVVQKLGSKIEQRENRYIELNKEHKLQGEREIAVLFEEADGIFARQQKRYRRKGNNSFELKIAIAHEGWKETAPNRFELANKTVVCDIASGKEFNKRKEAVLSSKYNTDEISVRIFNSDGGGWIKQLHNYNDEVHFQLDPFHIQKAIRTSDPGGDYSKQVSKMLRENRLDDLFNYLDAVANSLENKNTEERVRRLLSYLRDNRNGLIPYRKRGLNLPALPDGLVYKGMGNGEHNMFLVVAKRMKHRGACWSPQGGLRLCKLLCHKVSKTLDETIDSLTSFEIPERLRESSIKPLLSAGKAPKKDGKGYEGKHTSIPFVNYAVSNETKRTTMYEIKNSKKVGLTDRVRFRCIRCAECCRNVEGAVVVEVKDAYYLAKHLNISVSEFYEKYTRMFLLEDTGFPIFTLETVGKDNACIFLSKKRCSVQEAKPRTCKMYPFWICPDDNGGFQYNYSTERKHHPKGSLVRVKDWMRDNLSDEDKEFLTEDTRSLMEIAPLFNILHKRSDSQDAVMSKILMIRYFMYETDKPFYEQFCRNNRLLKKELQNMINNL